MVKLKPTRFAKTFIDVSMINRRRRSARLFPFTFGYRQRRKGRGVSLRARLIDERDDLMFAMIW
jgi:hypothetical protein